MKKLNVLWIIVILLITISFIGCSKEEMEIWELEAEIDTLTVERDKLLEEKEYLDGYIKDIRTSNNLEQYVLTLEIKQSHFTLDIGEHLKDSMNALELQIPVSKEYYDSVEKGTMINDDFRMGSLLFKSSIGKWKIKVIDKEIIL